VEHRLIKGDDGSEKWLSAARGFVARLKKLGLPYASQSYEVDGASINVSIEPGHEYIRIEGGGFCLLEMDNGIVDLISTGENSPNRFAPGILYETSHAAAYNAAFILGADGWRRKPATKPVTSAGQLSGIVSAGKTFVGKVPVDAKPALSYSPATQGVDQGGGITAYEDVTDDDMLYQNKLVTSQCPPSIFTGKCRLYVQSMYGRHLYKRANDNKTGDARSFPRSAGNVPAPAISVESFMSQSDTEALSGGEVPRILITTGSGVFLDKTTGKHWLINTGYWSVAVYPLIADTCGEKLRKHLVTSDPLTVDDIEHLEAYILSTCRPQASAVAVLSFPEIGGWAMGYSWHWNWTGDKADIVVQNQWLQEISDGKEWYKMSSEHFRLTITPTQVAATDSAPTTTTFTIALSTVEALTYWSVNRVFWCIAEPGWATGGMDKTTPKYTKMFACDAPFYVFYVRDALKVCRVHVEEKPAGDTVTESYGYRGNSMVTLPGVNGFNDTETDPSPYFVVTFDCAGVSTPDLPLHTTLLSYSKVVHVSQSEAGIYVDWGLFQEGVSYLYGDPPGLDNSGWDSQVIYARTHACQGTIYNTFTRTWGSGTIDYVGLATIIVPFYDAEAVFVHHSNTTTRSETGAYRQTLKTFHFHIVSAPRLNIPPNYPLGTVFIANNWYGVGYNSAQPPEDLGFDNPPDTEVTNVDESKQLVSRAGVTTAAMDDLPPFHDSLVETTGAGYGVISGTRVTDPVVISPTRITPIGSPVDKTSDAVLVGWV